MQQSLSKTFQTIATLIDQNQPGQAIRLLSQIKDKAKAFPRYHQLLGIAQAKSGDLNAAIRTLEQVIKLQPNVHFVHNILAKLYKMNHQSEEAMRHFDVAIKINPLSFDDFNNRGVLHTELHQWQEAEKDLFQALKINPNSPAVLNNLGFLYFHQRRLQKALKYYLAALDLDPKYVSALFNVANIYQNIGSYTTCCQYLKKLYHLQPEMPFFLGMYLYAKLHLCDWSDYAQMVEQMARQITAGMSPARPFQSMVVFDDPELQKTSAKKYIETKFPPYKNIKPFVPLKVFNRKIRVGYFSSDFCNHPITYLMTRVLQSHDRENYEVFAFAFHQSRDDEHTEMIKSAVDCYEDVRTLNDQELVELARSHQLDIAIDLNGITKGCRTGIFGHRVASIQINYLGYLGTIGVDYHDYIIADPVLIPKEERPHYSENVLSLPIYQANDDKEPDRSINVTRSQFGLPEEAFVFASFNNNFKIHPNIYKIWMSILKAVPSAVLWLYISNDEAKKNILETTQNLGVAPSRIVFAQKVPLALHTVRQTLANLFLDTFPYNGGATSTSAIRAGLPVLTLCGRSFSSRMGASLLTALGVEELITHSMIDYERKAIQFATDKKAYASIRHRVSQALQTTQLYNTHEFVKNLEQGYRMVLQKKGLLA
jgi:predicted O-linked N-acetylglucosamine transferase (SPINDLY family)